MLKKISLFLLIISALVAQQLLTCSFFWQEHKNSPYTLWESDKDTDNLTWQAQDWDPTQVSKTQPAQPPTPQELEKKAIHLNTQIETQKFFFDQLNNTGTDPFTGKKDKQTIINCLHKIKRTLDNIVQEAQREKVLDLIDLACVQTLQENIDVYLARASAR